LSELNKREKTLPFSNADIDEVIDYRGMQGTESLCHVRIFRNKPADVVLLTELSNNPENSITSCIEVIAGIVTTKYDLNPERTIWIEHCPPTDDDHFKILRRDETFDLATMQYDPNKKLIKNEEQGNRVVQTPFSQTYWKELAKEKAIEIVLTGKLK
jgi:hypothetical protein